MRFCCGRKQREEFRLYFAVAAASGCRRDDKAARVGAQRAGSTGRQCEQQASRGGGVAAMAACGEVGESRGLPCTAALRRRRTVASWEQFE